MAQCSNNFRDAFRSGTSGCVRTCECGKIFFDGFNERDWDWEEGELERLRDYVKLHPDEYFEVDGAVGTLDIDNKEIVIGCTCDLAGKYEGFIINHSVNLADYLNKRAEELRTEADAIVVTGE